MDERKRMIRELRGRRREALLAADRLLEELGAALLGRFAPAGGPADDKAEGAGAPEPGEAAEAACMPSPEDIADYHRFLREIEGCEGDIRIIDAGLVRLRELEEVVRRTEDAGAEEEKTLSGLYARLGELVLEDTGFADFAEPYRKQLEDLAIKARSLEDRLDMLTEKGDANLFSWIGKGAQTVVIRSFLGKNQKNIQRICIAAGEQFTHSAFREGPPDAAFRELLGEVEARRKAQAELAGELVRLREERRRNGESFGSEGNPQRRIRSLERQILLVRGQLRTVYLRCGARFEEALSAGGPAALLTADDGSLLGRIRELRKTIRDHEGQIEDLEVSLAIDEERERIAKREKAIAEQQQRITMSEGTIAELKGQIEEARQHIEKLSEKQ